MASPSEPLNSDDQDRGEPGRPSPSTAPPPAAALSQRLDAARLCYSGLDVMASPSEPLNSDDQGRPADHCELLYRELSSLWSTVNRSQIPHYHPFHRKSLNRIQYLTVCLREQEKLKQKQQAMEKHQRRKERFLSRDAEGNLVGPETVFPFAAARAHRRRLCPPTRRPGTSLESKIEWWNHVLKWLQDMQKQIDECNEKDLKDVSSLKRDKGDSYSAGYGIVKHRLVSRPAAGPESPEYCDWEQQQEHFQTCSLDKVFYGSSSLPRVSNIPSSDDVSKAAKFLKVHEMYQKKHWDYLGDVIFNLKPKVKAKLNDLARELNWRQTTADAHWFTKSEYLEGVPENKIVDDDLHPSSEEDYNDSPDEEEAGYRFDPYMRIHAKEVFHTTPLSYAMVNIHPLLPGHVLVCPKREVKRFTDLSAKEISDLWATAKEVGIRLERYHEASSLTFEIQDGLEAGQTVPHVRIHALRRKEGDFETNDETYGVLDVSDEISKLQVDTKGKDTRTEEMANLANQYRALFNETCSL